MTTVYICEEWSSYDEDNTIVAVFDNEDAAKRLEDTGIADGYTEFDVTSDFELRESIYQPFKYDVATGEFTTWGMRSHQVVAPGFGCRVLYEPSMGYKRWYQEPTPGHPQAIGSGQRRDATGIVSLTVDRAHDNAEALRKAQEAIGEWKLAK